jgi:hypothetical protein
MADIHVNGRTYPLVSLDELTLDEAMVVYDYTKLSLDQIPDLEGFHPGLIAALIHVAVQRGEPRETARQIRQTVGAIPVASLEQVFMDISEEVPDDVDPPPAAKPTNGSGGGSSTSSEPAPDDVTLVSTGSPGSDTGATWPRQTWEP